MHQSVFNFLQGVKNRTPRDGSLNLSEANQLKAIFLFTAKGNPISNGDDEMQALIIHGMLMLKFRNLGAEKMVKKVLFWLS